MCERFWSVMVGSFAVMRPDVQSGLGLRALNRSGFLGSSCSAFW
jgi:hypothetical protein